jgi:uncharacterized Zn finger protein (UPF0148 family)
VPSETGFGYYPCSNRGKYEVDGKWYCGVHNPEAVKRREERIAERDRRRQEQWDRQWKKEQHATKAANALRGIDDPEAWVAEVREVLAVAESVMRKRGPLTTAQQARILLQANTPPAPQLGCGTSQDASGGFDRKGGE